MVGKDRQMRTVITEEHPIENLYAKSLKRDDTVFVDFGEYAVALLVRADGSVSFLGKAFPRA